MTSVLSLGNLVKGPAENSSKIANRYDVISTEPSADVFALLFSFFSCLSLQTPPPTYTYFQDKRYQTGSKLESKSEVCLPLEFNWTHENAINIWV